MLNPLDLIEDPYSDEGRYLLKVTNIRIKMWNPQVCPSCVNRSLADSTLYQSRHHLSGRGNRGNLGRAGLASDSSSFFTRFAIYDLIIRGTCFCNGHADTCIPLHEDDMEPDDQEQDVVGCLN